MASSTAVWYCWLDAWVSAAAIVVGFGTHTSVWFRLLSFHTPTCPATAEHAVASDCSSSSSGSITVSVAQTLILAYHALLLGFVVSGSKWYRKEDNRNVLVLGLRLFCVVHAITRMVLEGAHFPPVDGATASQLSMSSAWRTFLLLLPWKWHKWVAASELVADILPKLAEVAVGGVPIVPATVTSMLPALVCYVLPSAVIFRVTPRLRSQFSKSVDHGDNQSSAAPCVNCILCAVIQDLPFTGWARQMLLRCSRCNKHAKCDPGSAPGCSSSGYAHGKSSSMELGSTRATLRTRLTVVPPKAAELDQQSGCVTTPKVDTSSVQPASPAPACTTLLAAPLACLDAPASPAAATATDQPDLMLRDVPPSSPRPAATPAVRADKKVQLLLKRSGGATVRCDSSAAVLARRLQAAKQSAATRQAAAEPDVTSSCRMPCRGSSLYSSKIRRLLLSLKVRGQHDQAAFTSTALQLSAIASATCQREMPQAGRRLLAVTAAFFHGCVHMLLNVDLQEGQEQGQQEEAGLAAGDAGASSSAAVALAAPAARAAAEALVEVDAQVMVPAAADVAASSAPAAAAAQQPEAAPAGPAGPEEQRPVPPVTPSPSPATTIIPSQQSADELLLLALQRDADAAQLGPPTDARLYLPASEPGLPPVLHRVQKLTGSTDVEHLLEQHRRRTPGQLLPCYAQPYCAALPAEDNADAAQSLRLSLKIPGLGSANEQARLAKAASAGGATGADADGGLYFILVAEQHGKVLSKDLADLLALPGDDISFAVPASAVFPGLVCLHLLDPNTADVMASSAVLLLPDERCCAEARELYSCMLREAAVVLGDDMSAPGEEELHAFVQRKYFSAFAVDMSRLLHLEQAADKAAAEQEGEGEAEIPQPSGGVDEAAVHACAQHLVHFLMDQDMWSSLEVVFSAMGSCGIPIMLHEEDLEVEGEGWEEEMQEEEAGEEEMLVQQQAVPVAALDSPEGEVLGYLAATDPAPAPAPPVAAEPPVAVAVAQAAAEPVLEFPAAVAAAAATVSACATGSRQASPEISCSPESADSAAERGMSTSSSATAGSSSSSSSSSPHLRTQSSLLAATCAAAEADAALEASCLLELQQRQRAARPAAKRSTMATLALFLQSMISSPVQHTANGLIRPGAAALCRRMAVPLALLLMAFTVHTLQAHAGVPASMPSGIYHTPTAMAAATASTAVTAAAALLLHRSRRLVMALRVLHLLSYSWPVLLAVKLQLQHGSTLQKEARQGARWQQTLEDQRVVLLSALACGVFELLLLLLLPAGASGHDQCLGTRGSTPSPHSHPSRPGSSKSSYKTSVASHSGEGGSKSSAGFRLRPHALRLAACATELGVSIVLPVVQVMVLHVAYRHLLVAAGLQATWCHCVGLLLLHFLHLLGLLLALGAWPGSRAGLRVAHTLRRGSTSTACEAQVAS